MAQKTPEHIERIVAHVYRETKSLKDTIETMVGICGSTVVRRVLHENRLCEQKNTSCLPKPEQVKRGVSFDALFDSYFRTTPGSERALTTLAEVRRRFELGQIGSVVVADEDDE